MIAALQPLAEMLALEAHLLAALEEAKRKLKAIEAAKSAAGSETPSGQRIPPGQEPQWWLLGPILNGPETELGGSAGATTPNYTPQGKG